MPQVFVYCCGNDACELPLRDRTLYVIAQARWGCTPTRCSAPPQCIVILWGCTSTMCSAPTLTEACTAHTRSMNHIICRIRSSRINGSKPLTTTAASEDDDATSCLPNTSYHPVHVLFQSGSSRTQNEYSNAQLPYHTKLMTHHTKLTTALQNFAAMATLFVLLNLK